MNKGKWSHRSLEWIHEVREAHYEETEDLPIAEWLKPLSKKELAALCQK